MAGMNLQEGSKDTSPPLPPNPVVNKVGGIVCSIDIRSLLLSVCQQIIFQLSKE